MFKVVLTFVLLFIIVLMPFILSLVPGIKNINLGASKNGYVVTIEKYRTKKKTRKKKK